MDAGYRLQPHNWPLGNQTFSAFIGRLESGLWGHASLWWRLRMHGYGSHAGVASGRKRSLAAWEPPPQDPNYAVPGLIGAQAELGP